MSALCGIFVAAALGASDGTQDWGTIDAFEHRGAVDRVLVAQLDPMFTDEKQSLGMAQLELMFDRPSQTVSVVQLFGTEIVQLDPMFGVMSQSMKVSQLEPMFGHLAIER